MRESIGGTFLFQIAIVFILLFAGYLALSVNYSRAFKVKNEILNIIERNEGLRINSQDEITGYLNSVGHSVSGVCPTGFVAYGTRNSNRGVYCAKKKCEEATSCSAAVGGLFKAHYKIVVFFKFDLPVFGDLFTFRVEGETKTIYNAPCNPMDDLACAQD